MRRSSPVSSSWGRELSRKSRLARRGKPTLVIMVRECSAFWNLLADKSRSTRDVSTRRTHVALGGSRSACWSCVASLSAGMVSLSNLETRYNRSVDRVRHGVRNAIVQRLPVTRNSRGVSRDIPQCCTALRQSHSASS